MDVLEHTVVGAVEGEVNAPVRASLGSMRGDQKSACAFAVTTCEL